MKFHKSKFLTTVAAAALVLAVGACSSSSDDNEGMSMLQTDLDAATAKAAALQEDLDEANAALMALETLIGDETDPAAESLRGQLAAANARIGSADDADSLEGMLAAEQAAVVRLEGLIGDETDPADDSLKGQLAAANARIGSADDPDSLEGQLAAARAEIDNDDPLNLGLMQQLAVANARLELVAKELKAKEEAAKDEAASDKAAAVLVALNPATVTPAPMVDLAASSSGAVTAKSGGYMMSANAPDAITGYRGKILTTDTAELHVYTNIADAVATPISHLYRSENLQGKPAVYTVTDDGTNDSIMWSQAKRADSVTTETGTGDDAVTTFNGTVRGVAGTFSCTAPCTVPTVPQDAAALTGASGAWTFVPTNANGMIDVPDAAYLSFGWWLNQLADDTYQTDVFTAVEGMDPNTQAAATVDGTATYKGGAAGKWAIASTTDDTTAGGHFTATATLTANFDASNDPRRQPERH